MLGLSHVVLHIGFCNAIARLNPQTPVAVHVRLTDSGKDVEFDRTFRVPRGEESETAVEFDAHRGTYRLTIEAGGQKCSAFDYLYFIPDHDRNVTELLAEGVAPAIEPMLLSGSAPMSFSYAKPTFILVSKSVACKAPIGAPLPAQVQVERDRDGYYVWLYDSAAIEAAGPVTVAMRIGTATGQFHYIRVPMDFPVPWRGWPGIIQFNVTEDQIDELAGEPVDTLLCPKLWKTTVS